MYLTTCLRPALHMSRLAMHGLGFGPEDTGRRTTIEDVKRQMREAVRTLEDYGGEQREEAYQKARELQDDMDRRIDEMRAQAHRLQGDAARQWEEAAHDMEQRRERLEERLEAFRKDSGNAWQHMRDGFTSAYRDLGDAFERAWRSWDR